MKLLLICGPWGSGTSAVAGLLARLGAVGFGPFFNCSDPFRPNTYELLAFRDALDPFLSEVTLSLSSGSEKEVESSLRLLRIRIENQEFGPYDGTAPIFLKYPLSALVIPQICNIFETRLIYVLRSLADIELTRLRRRWYAELGKQGAEVIYASMFRVLVEHAYPTMILKYTELLKASMKIAQELVQFAELGAGPAEVQNAAAFINSPLDKLLARPQTEPIAT